MKTIVNNNWHGPESDRGRVGAGSGLGQSQSRRLKIMYRLAQTTPIRPTAKG